MGDAACCGSRCPETVVGFGDGEIILFETVADPANEVDGDVVIAHWRVSSSSLVLPTDEQGTYTWLVPLEYRTRYLLSVATTLTLDADNTTDGGVIIWYGSDSFTAGFNSSGQAFVHIPGEVGNRVIGTLDTVSGPITVSLSLREFPNNVVRLTASVGAVQYSVLIEDMVLSTDSDTWPMGVFLDNNAVNTSAFSQVTVSACGPSGSSSSSSSSSGSKGIGNCGSCVWVRLTDTTWAFANGVCDGLCDCDPPPFPPGPSGTGTSPAVTQCYST